MDYKMEVIFGDEIVADFLHPLGAMVLVEPDDDGTLRLRVMGSPDTDAGITALTILQTFVQLAQDNDDNLETMPIEGNA
tara:strand:+ start:1567 stop:1803 length:237 start_codon:yes stop_codon:yes gene_type:complete